MDKSTFICGIIQLIIGITLLIVCVHLERFSRLGYVVLPILCGIGNIIDGMTKHK